MKLFNKILLFCILTNFILMRLITAADAAMYKGIFIPDTEPYAHSDILSSKQVEAAKADFFEGFKLYNTKNYKAAIDRFLKSIESFPYENEAFYWLAQSYYMLGDYPASVDALKQNPKQTKFIRKRIQYLESDKDLKLNDSSAEKSGVKKAGIIKSVKFDDKQFVSPVNISYYNDLIYILSSADKSLTVIDKDYNLKHKNTGFSFPYGMALNKGKLYISDFKENAVYVFYADTFKLIRKIELKNSGYSPNGTTNISVDEKENIYLLDSGAKSIVKIDENGKLLFRTDNFKHNYFRAVTDIKWHLNSVYVLDAMNFKILRFDESGNKLSEFDIERKHTVKPASLNIFENDIIITDANEGVNNNKFAVYSLESGEFTGYLMDIGKRANIVNLAVNSKQPEKTEYLYDSNNNELLKKVNEITTSKYEFGNIRLMDIALNADTPYALIFPGNRVFEFSPNLQKTNELKLALYNSNEIESFEIYDGRFIIKYAKPELPVSVFMLNGEPVNLPLEDKNLCAYSKTDNDTEIKAYRTADNVYKVNLIDDTAFISLKYLKSAGGRIYIYDDFYNKIFIYGEADLKLTDTVNIPEEYRLKKIMEIDNKIYLISAKSDEQPFIYNLETGEFENMFNLPDRPLVSGACYRIIKSDNSNYFYIELENSSVTTLQYYEKLKENYLIDIKNVDYISMFPHIITNIRVRDASGKNISGLNENHFEVFEGYPQHEMIETRGMHNYSLFDNNDSTLDFRKQFMVTPVSVKPFERYTNLHNIAILIDNTAEFNKDFKLARNFVDELLKNLNYFRFKVDLWGLMNGTPENLIANTTDRFEIMRLFDKSLDFAGENIDFTDYIERAAESASLYKNLKTLIFVTSSDKNGELVLDARLKKLIRFLRNNDINVEFVNFNRKPDTAMLAFSEFFYKRYLQYPEIQVKNILNFIDEYNSGNYTVFYRNKIRLQTYNRLNQFITLKYLSNTGEIRGGYFIP